MADFPAQQVVPNDWGFSEGAAGPIDAQLVSFVPTQSLDPGILAQETAFDVQYRTSVFFVMRAYNTTLLQYVYWKVENATDFGGLFSGYPPVQLSGTSLIGTYL
jgi:hypothetical protein